MWSSLLICMAALPVRDNCSDLFVPNAVSINMEPGGHVFHVSTSCKFSEFKLILIDRWGNEKFQTTDPAFGLDMFEEWKKEDLSYHNGTYYYIIKARKEGAKRFFTRTGAVVFIN